MMAAARTDNRAVCGVEGCTHIEPNPMLMGLHRKRAHGIAGKGKPKLKGVRAKREDRAPKAKVPRAPSLKADLRRVFKMVGTVVAVVDPYCGGVLVQHSGAFCDSLARLAETDPRIARWLKALSKAGPYGALAVAAGELIVPIAAHHRLVAPGLSVLVGVAPPPGAMEGDGKRMDAIDALIADTLDEAERAD